MGYHNSTILSLAINHSGHIFAGTFFEGVFRSTNNGDNWIAINNGLPAGSVSSLFVDTNGDIYGGTSVGVFRSTDNGNSWQELNSGLINIGVGSLAENSNGFLFAGTRGSGVYKSTNPTEILDPNPTISANKYRLFQNFPNPFNPSTTIRYYIPLRQRVSLLIYNVSGQLGRILVNELRSKGEYAEVWKGRDEQGRVVSNGIYFYSLKVDRKIIDTKKWCLSNKIAIYNTTAQNRHRKDWIKINC